MKEKRTISDDQLKSELIKLFEAGNTDKGKCAEVLGSKFKFQVQRFYKIFNSTHQEWATIKQKAEAEAIQANATDSLKLAIMDANERKELLTKIAKGEIEILINEPRWDHGQKKFVKIPVLELPNYANRISALQELNKMGGDYAPTKSSVEITDKPKWIIPGENEESQ